MTKSVRDILNEAAALVEAGWCRHHFKMDIDLDGVVASSCYCATGAISKASGGSPASEESGLVSEEGKKALGVLADSIFGRDSLGGDWFNELNVGWWNDEQLAAAYVAHALRKAAQAHEIPA